MIMHMRRGELVVARAARLVAPVLGSVFAAIAAMMLAPNANAAAMRIGNYEVLTDRWNDHSFVFAVAFSCGAPDCGTYLEDTNVVTPTDNRNVIAIPRPPKSQRFQGTAFYADGQYTLTVDVIDGVRCIGYNLPSHDVYTWDAATLNGTITSTFDADCYGGPGGSRTYGFNLQRL
jgi:hypothetical protein